MGGAVWQPGQIQRKTIAKLCRPGGKSLFALLAVLIWPFIAVAVVGGYGFLVWMWQIVFGPPGPPAS